MRFPNGLGRLGKRRVALCKTFPLLFLVSIGCEVPAMMLGGNGPTPLISATAAKASAVLASCIPGQSASAWLDQFYRVPRLRSTDPDAQVTSKFSQALDCLAARKNGCSAIGDCLSIGVDLSGPCTSRCDGNVAERCTDTVKMRIDCARYGLVCSPQTNRCEAVATLGSCMSPGFVGHCEGGRPFYCGSDGFLRLGAVCADFGLTCVEGKDECQGVGVGVCSSPPGKDYVLGCDSNQVLRCTGERTALLDCARVADRFTCQYFGSGGGASFCGKDRLCSPSTDEPRCEGTFLSLCNGGKIEHINCTELGFAGCDASRNRCTPGVYL